ncbi:hypothetical protein EV702DRAFT_1042875 [Suillus placidus]|uniref:Uncharacterized protein n=1 Tax=Suillus placidus TaxID=48579 RepID=A0A9P7A394_9AGAM|nr:hypothetical protein EV702DRAFT_1042872 [Suillus placidus]KAG1780618.1 hypothetical protein EV702DRAFT_1042875 [Suillus placidus]
MIRSTTNIGARRCGKWNCEVGSSPSSSSFSTKDNLDAVGSGFDVGDESGSALLGAGAGTWRKTHSRRLEWSGRSNLTFSLAPGWEFVETEGWVSAPSVSVSGSGDPIFGADDNGLVYTNTVWADLRRIPLEAWKASGMTRRRSTACVAGKINVRGLAAGSLSI